MKSRIVYVDCSPLMLELLSELVAPEGLSVHEGDPDRSTLQSLIADAAVVINGHTVMDAALIVSARLLRSVVFLGTGASSYIDIEAAEMAGVRVRTSRGYGDRTVAEHTFGMLLAAARNSATSASIFRSLSSLKSLSSSPSSSTCSAN